MTAITIASMVAISLVFLFNGSYARVQTAEGSIEPSAGAVAVMARRPGILNSLEVREGQSVGRGQRMLTIQAEETLAGGGTLAAQVRSMIDGRSAELDRQREYTKRAAAADRDRLAMQIIGARSEIGELDRQIEDQRHVLDIAARDFAKASEVAARGFISRNDLDRRELSLIERRKELFQLEQQRSSKLAQVKEIGNAIRQSGANADVQLAVSALNRSELLEQLLQSASLSGYSVTAPIDGSVTAVQVKEGQSVAQGERMFSVVPRNSPMQAELRLPTSAAAFVAPGQTVRLAVDAFPYDQYGTLDAVVRSVSMTTVPFDPQSGTATAKRGYLVVAAIGRPWFTIDGRRRALTAGMSVSGRIVTERRTLAQWLLGPLLSISRR
jgi:membrane fusion protein